MCTKQGILKVCILNNGHIPSTKHQFLQKNLVAFVLLGKNFKLPQNTRVITEIYNICNAPANQNLSWCKHHAFCNVHWRNQHEKCRELLVFCVFVWVSIMNNSFGGWGIDSVLQCIDWVPSLAWTLCQVESSAMKVLMHNVDCKSSQFLQWCLFSTL